MIEGLNDPLSLLKKIANGAIKGDLTDKSGTANGSSQTLSVANATRSYFLFQNPSGNTDSMWINPTGATAIADSPSIEIPPGQGLAWGNGFIPTAALKVIGTSGEKWTAYEF